MCCFTSPRTSRNAGSSSYLSRSVLMGAVSAAGSCNSASRTALSLGRPSSDACGACAQHARDA
jgi:hypothetical protein